MTRLRNTLIAGTVIPSLLAGPLSLPALAGPERLILAQADAGGAAGDEVLRQRKPGQKPAEGAQPHGGAARQGAEPRTAPGAGAPATHQGVPQGQQAPRQPAAGAGQQPAHQPAEPRLNARPQAEPGQSAAPNRLPGQGQPPANRSLQPGAPGMQQGGQGAEPRRLESPARKQPQPAAPSGGQPAAPSEAKPPVPSTAKPAAPAKTLAPGTAAPAQQAPKTAAPDETLPATPGTPKATAPRQAAPPAGEAPAAQGTHAAPGQTPPAPRLPARQAPAQPNAAPAAPIQQTPAQGAPAPAAPAQGAPAAASPTPAAPAAAPVPQAQPRAAQPLPGQAAPAAGPAVAPAAQPKRSGMSPAGAAALGAAAGFVGGFMASQGAQRLDDVRQQRQEYDEGGVRVIREPGRTIVRENDRVYLRHDETERFRELGGDVRSEQRGDEQVTIYRRANGSEVITVTDENGRLLRRVRRDPSGREEVLIDNSWDRRPRRLEEDVVVLPPPDVRMPRERYIVDADQANEETIYETLTAPPIAPLPKRYTLDEVRYSPDLRARMRSVDVNTINFETGSWAISPDQEGRLGVIAQAIRRAIDRNPREVFLVEGHTDAVGSDIDNLSLSDRRAQSAAAALTRDFGVPPENLTTQGYGEQYLRVQTEGPSRENRRVTVRRITPLLNGPEGQAQ